MRLGTWNVGSLYRAGSLKAAARELTRYKLDLVGVQEVRWDKGGTVRAGDYNFFYGKGNEKHGSSGSGCVDWIGLAQDRDRWRALVSAVMNLQVPENAGNFLTSCNQLASQEGLCSME
jgi:exonuclease III